MTPARSPIGRRGHHPARRGVELSVQTVAATRQTIPPAASHALWPWILSLQRNPKGGGMRLYEEIDFRDFARAVGTMMTYRKDDAVFRESERPQYMYVLLSGSVDIVSHGKVIETIREGAAMGIVSLLDGQPRTSTALARETSEVAIIDGRKFRYMVEEMPNFVWYVMAELAHRLRTTNAAL